MAEGVLPYKYGSHDRAHEHPSTVVTVGRMQYATKLGEYTIGRFSGRVEESQGNGPTLDLVCRKLCAERQS